eukprot:CAMPEP_0180292412 /NCGR_PEP_ID=MMETSP0988-20121125/16760_1 /TAXON_ID=697907 /ORGANISM="non described non described, Strain CCMP2293" /LENGTH=86 /DNA_ID=CAMNT_0022268539 /DNA_START=51 /DNA_END=307 /DNA_ORIENTATION=+
MSEVPLYLPSTRGHRAASAPTLWAGGELRRQHAEARTKLREVIELLLGAREQRRVHGPDLVRALDRGWHRETLRVLAHEAVLALCP